MGMSPIHDRTTSPGDSRWRTFSGNFFSAWGIRRSRSIATADSRRNPAWSPHFRCAKANLAWHRALLGYKRGRAAIRRQRLVSFRLAARLRGNLQPAIAGGTPEACRTRRPDQGRGNAAVETVNRPRRGIAPPPLEGQLRRQPPGLHGGRIGGRGGGEVGFGLGQPPVEQLPLGGAEPAFAAEHGRIAAGEASDRKADGRRERRRGKRHAAGSEASGRAAPAPRAARTSRPRPAGRSRRRPTG